MKNVLLFVLLFSGQFLSAQMFTEVPKAFPFDNVSFSSVAFSDIDGDGDEDVLITGRKNISELIAKLYTNNGGSFTEVTGTPFEGVSDGAVAFADVDNDGDQDVLITGLNGSIERIAKLYTNDEENFTEVVGTPFVGVRAGAVAFADVDDDGDQDLLITGANESDERIAKLYTNADGSFMPAAGTPFAGVKSGSVAFSDVDNDGDQDLLITGVNESDERIAKLYTNVDGDFTEVMDTPFDGAVCGVRWLFPMSTMTAITTY